MCLSYLIRNVHSLIGCVIRCVIRRVRGEGLMYFGWCVFLTLSVMFIQVRIRRKVNTDNPPVYLLLFEVAVVG